MILNTDGLEVLSVASERQIDIWATSNIRSLDIVRRAETLLSDDELRRARHFYTASLQHAFIVARALMRVIIADYTGERPETLCLAYGAHGKPFLPKFAQFHFNLSHSDNAVVLAVSRASPVGVDVEHVRPVSNVLDLAERFFCSSETASLKRLSGEAQSLAFLKYWTRKEACMKAVGSGLSLAPETICLSSHWETQPLLLNIGDVRGSDGWRLADISYSPEHAAALAYRGENMEVRIHRCRCAANTLAPPRPFDIRGGPESAWLLDSCPGCAAAPEAHGSVETIQVPRRSR